MDVKNILYKYGLIRTPEISFKPRKAVRNTKGNLFDILTNDEKEFHEKINEYGLLQEEIDKILNEMFLFHKMTDGSFLYAWDKHDSEGKENGAAKFSAVANASLYKEQINDTEKSIFQDDYLDIVIEECSKNKSTHIELGPETGEKFIQYSDEWDPNHMQLNGKKYIGIDVSGVYVDMANKNVGKIGMVCESVPGDWFKHSIFESTKDQIYYFFGGSIGNLDVGYAEDSLSSENKTIINLLKRMKSNQPFKSVPAVITYFEAPDKTAPDYQDTIDKLRATYGAKDSPYYDEKTYSANADFILSGLEALGVKKSNIELMVKYEDETSTHPGMIKVGAKFTERTEIQIGQNKIVKETGDVVRIIKSQRFSKEMFSKIAKEAGFALKYQKSQNGLVVAVLQSKIGINDRFQKARNIGYGILIGAIVLGGGLLTKNILHQKEIQEQQRKMDKEFVSKQKMFFYVEAGYGYYELDTEGKIEYINKLTDGVWENLSIRYDLNTDEDETKKIIRSYIKDKEILEKFANTDNYTYNIFDISDDFVKKYSDFLIEKDIDKLPYEHLKKYESYFKDLIVDPNMKNEDMVQIYKGSSGLSIHNYLLSPAPNFPIYFDIQLECINNGVKRELTEQKTISVMGEDDMKIKMFMGQRTDIESYYVKDGYLYVKKRIEKKSYPYIVATGKNGDERKKIDPMIIAYDYFYQNKPIIHEVYKKFGVIYRDISSDRNRENNQTYRWKKDSIRMMITKDLLQTGLLDNISPDNNDIAILAYVQGFAQRNSAFLKQEGMSPIPYEAYKKHYGESFENTEKTITQDIPEMIEYDNRRKEYKFHYVGKYYTQQGIEYDLGEVTINGKKYIYARNVVEDNYEYHSEEGMDIPNIGYYLRRGKEVSKDFFSLNKKK